MRPNEVKDAVFARILDENIVRLLNSLRGTISPLPARSDEFIWLRRRTLLPTRYKRCERPRIPAIMSALTVDSLLTFGTGCSSRANEGRVS